MNGHAESTFSILQIMLSTAGLQVTAPRWEGTRTTSATNSVAEVAPIMYCLTDFLHKARTDLQLSGRGAVCRQLAGFRGDSAC